MIAHDLDVVRRLADRVKVMYLGRVVEEGAGEDVYNAPRHPYSHALLSARPIADPARARAQKRIVLEGDVPSPLNPPSGCVFHTRCPKAQAVCSAEVPSLAPAGAAGHEAACHFKTETGA